jgi:two-component system, OmpR family, sensor histidine kinase MtrB
VGLRSKLGLIFVGVSGLAILVLGAAVYTQAQSARLDRARTLADERVTAAAQLYLVTGRLCCEAKLDDPQLPSAVRDAVAQGKRVTFKTDASDPRLWAAQQMPDGKIVSTVDEYEQSDNAMDDLERALVVGGIGTVALVALVSVIAAGSLSRRILAVSGTARRIARGELDASAVTAVGKRSSDEVASLAADLDTMAASLRAQLEAERRFTADVAHDLRTPVTGLLTAAELLPPGRPSELVRDRAKVLRTLVEDLLEVARFDSGVERADLEQVDLGAFVESAVSRLQTQQALSPDSITVHRNGPADPSSKVMTDPRRVERILANLVVNGVRHGAPPVDVRVSGRTIEVIDHGTGYPPELIAEGPRRFRSGKAQRGGGHGLGLTIAAGHADVLGARLVFGTAPGGGALTSLELPIDPGVR